jgi:P4 family phage/plasmid primase-like protien
LTTVQERKHWCFTHDKLVDREIIERTCKVKGHDIDYEDTYTPPSRVRVSKQVGEKSKAELHADLVEYIAQKMFDKTHLVYLEPERVFYYWNWRRNVWEPQGNSFLMKLFNEISPRIIPNKKKLFLDVVFQLQCDVVISPKNFRPDPNYLYFKNRALKLDTLEDYSKDKEHYIQCCLDTELDLKAKPPMIFLKALSIALPDPLEWFDCLQALSSILLIRSQRIEKAFFFLGSGGNGKSTIMKILDNIFVNYIAHVDMNDLQNDGFSKTALVDKLANSFSEISKMKQKDISVFKAIASGDTQSVNSKFKERFDSVIKVIQFYSSNQMPEIENVNEGFIRRAHPIEFNQKILVKDPYIDDKLNTDEERMKILALLVKMAKVTRKYGFIYEKTSKEKENILLKKTDPINEFLSANIVLKREEYTISKVGLYTLYCQYCKSKEFRPVNTLKFSRFLTSVGFTYGGRNENPHWIGIGQPPKDEGQESL